jgi:hypothetical protein
MDEQVNTVKTVLKVTTDFEASTYTVEADSGSSVNEMAFAVMVVIRTLLKNGLIERPEDFIDLVNKYRLDPQYQEVEAVNDGE